MGSIDQYVFLIGASLIIIVSYLFGVISKRTNIPSVLMLIALGVVLHLGFDQLQLQISGIVPLLKVLGVIGLIMIVLEAALDLKLKREKWGLIWKSFSVALLALVAQTFVIAFIFQLFFDLELLVAMAYAIPLAIMSSAIVLPSVDGLSEEKREFMIYEATFSDILGIIFFYSLLENLEVTNTTEVVAGVSGNILLTIAVSLVLSYALAYIFHRLVSGIKLFLLISVLILLYAIGKQFHLSSLIIILTFGLVMNNYRLFFPGILTKWFKEKEMKEVLEDLHLITAETAFVVRTFFFVVFGISISLATLLDLEVVLVSCVLILVMYLIRGVFLRVFRGGKIFPEIYISPRGLITILLFYTITQQSFFQDELYAEISGILLFVIIVSSLIMTFALVRNGKRKKAELELEIVGGEVISEEEASSPEGEEVTKDTPADPNVLSGNDDQKPEE